MTTGRRKRATIELGHDAFLDIVANLVGILIILVVVMGTQSHRLVEEVREQAEAIEEVSDDQLAELTQEHMRAVAAQADSRRFERQISEYDSRIEAIDRQRSELLDLLAIAEEAWEENQSQIDAAVLDAAKRNRQHEALSEQLTQIRGQQQSLENQSSPVQAVAHLPTPMAKTVFGDELHFRLEGNRLAVVPLERLMEEIKTDLRRNLQSSRLGELTSAVGPIRGFVAEYAMVKDQALTNRGGGIGMTTRGQLVGMAIKPLGTPSGQPIENVLAGSSELDVELAGRDPNTTTITVWVYPDSYGSFRRLKEHLYARGFATAARPLETGRPITGGPQGSRSIAQ